MPGQSLIRSRYRPLETIGEGGQGRVIKALDIRHDRLVAVKVRHIDSEQAREVILAEARILLTLRPHPNIALLREDFFLRDGYYLVMDWVEGRNLRRALREDGNPGLPLETVLPWLQQVAEALDHMHAHEPPIIHKDVKPANIIATPEGRAILVDFGISAPSGKSGLSGTPGFVAPELGLGMPASPAADVFGLAATAVALLTGGPPVPGTRPTWGGVDRAQAGLLDMAMRRALAFDPTRRPAGASELIESMRVSAPPPGNVPLQLTTFIGREGECAEVERLVGEDRLVTLTGAGGVGKTRLALRVASELGNRLPDGAWFLELGTLTDPGLVAQTVATALHVRPQPDRSFLDTLLDHLGTRTLLLVLDNCEHLVSSCAELVASVLRTCPHVRVLATSREPLGVEGELVWRVPTLETPRFDPRLSPEEVMRSDSVRLFVDRAKLAKPGFELTPANTPLVAEICRRLDGIPLAIELAAPRVKVLSLKEIAGRLGDRLGLLTAGSRSALPHHQTLTATMDWSHDLLSGSEKRLFDRLGVFAGGCTLAAVESICGDGIELVTTLGGLVDKSLLTTDECGGQTRYSMLQIVRDYAWVHLLESGESEALSRRHVAWFAGLAEHAERELTGRDQAAWVERLEAELDNVRAALRTAERTDPETGLRIAVSLWRFWVERGYVGEARAWVAQGLGGDGGAEPFLRAKALAVAGVLAFEQADYSDARPFYEESLALARSLGDEALLGWTLNDLGLLASREGDLDAARTLYEESLAVKRRIGDLRAIAFTIGNLGVLAQLRGDFAESRALLEECLSIDRKLGITLNIAHDLYYFGDLSLAEGDHDRASELYRAALTALRDEPGGRELIPSCLEGLAMVAARRGAGDQLARLLGAAEAMRDAMGTRLPPLQRRQIQESLELTRDGMDRHAMQTARAEGAAMVFEEAVAYALSV